ncbi:MAG: T9SS type A sorting domain-containing protein, partial [candidate division WOR-3 bacterium]
IFWYRAASSEFYETLLVRVDTILNGLDTINFSIIIDTVITNSTDWQHRIIPFNRILIDSASVYVAFHYPCDNNFYIAIDDVILPRIDTVYDFFPVSFNTPKLPIIVDSTYQVSAIFRNNSVTQELLSLYVFYQIVGENIFYKESVWVGIGGGNSEDVEFANFLPTVSETVAIKIWTAYPDDENKHNDTLFKKAFIAPKFYAPPYEKDFNEDWGVYGDNPPLGGWRIIQGGNRDTIWNTNDWYRDTIRIGDNVRQVAMVYYSPLENQFERLISPRIDCSSPGLYNLHYWHWYQNYDPSLRDSGVVLISTNGGFTWPVRLARYFNINDSGYKTINITSSVAGQSNVRICFLYGGYNEYWWAIDDFSIEWIPFGPVLLSPANGFETYNRTVQFAWQPINNVSSYLIEIAYDSLFQATVISETVNVDTISFSFEPETYYWRVKAVQPIGQYSETRKFKILLMPVGWVKYPNIPIQPSGKPVKDGGAVCFCPIDSCIYVLKGNNTRDFYARHYFLGNYDWITKTSIPIDTAKRRNVKKGSAICFAESLIYVIKGNKTNEFYAYNPKTDSWIRKRDVPGTKGLKAGSSITFVPPMSKNNYHLSNRKNLVLNTKKDKQESGYIYLLKGSSKEFEFLAYSIANDSWEIRARAPAGPNSKPFKAGSGIVYAEAENKIYALKGGGKYNEFYFYDVSADSWSHFPGDTIPRGINKRKVKDGGALTYCDGKIYAIKGGGKCNEFWCYSESLGEKRWVLLDSIPKDAGLPKAGAGLTAGAGIIYLIKGNNTTECWAYFPRSEDKLISQEFQSNKSSVTANISSQPVKSNYRFNIEVHPNPAKGFINICYSINEPMPLTVKLYDITGQALTIIKDANIISPGIYQQKLSIDNLANGIYFISLENYQKKVIAKFIVQ